MDSAEYNKLSQEDKFIRVWTEGIFLGDIFKDGSICYAIDEVYKALIKRGLKLPEHSSKVYSNITNDKMYDQIAFLPSIKSKIVAHGVFDYDTTIFPELWDPDNPLEFRAYLRYYMSDHRPLWMQLDFD